MKYSSQVAFLTLKFTLSRVNVATPVFFLIRHGISFIPVLLLLAFLNSMFYVSLVSFIYLGFLFLIPSDSLQSTAFILFTFNVITDIFVFKSTLFAFYFFPLYVCFFSCLFCSFLPFCFDYFLFHFFFVSL